MKIPHLVWQLSPCIAIPEPLGRGYWSLWALETVLPNKRSHRKEKPAEHNWRGNAAQRNQWRPTTTKSKQINETFFKKRFLDFTFKVKKKKFEIMKSWSMWQLRLLVAINVKQLMRSKINHHCLPTHTHPFIPPSPRKQSWRWTFAVSHGHSDLKKYISAGFLIFAHLITEHLKGTGFTEANWIIEKAEGMRAQKTTVCIHKRFTKLKDLRDTSVSFKDKYPFS